MGKHLAHEARAQGPAGLPTASTIHDAGFFGVRTSRSTKTRHVVGVRFPEPAKGSFYDGLVSHNDHLAKAREERYQASLKLAALERKERRALWDAGVVQAKLKGFAPSDPEWPQIVRDLAIAQMLRTEAATPSYHRPSRSCVSSGGTGDNALTSIRRPSPVEARGPVTRGTSGAARRVKHDEVFTLRQAFPAEQQQPEPDVARKRPHSADGLTPPLRQSPVETFVETDGGVIVHRQRRPFERRTSAIEGAKPERRVLTAIRVSAVPTTHRRAAAAPDQFFGASHNADGRLPKMG
jgi:hypothetical protein